MEVCLGFGRSNGTWNSGHKVAFYARHGSESFIYIHSFTPYSEPARYYHCFHFTDEEIDIKQ